MTITRSGRKYFAGGVNLHEENVFGMLLETFGTPNLNISGRYYRRTQCTYEQERPRLECADGHASLQFHVRHALQKWSDQPWNSGIAVTLLTEILEYYQNTREKYRNTCEDTNTGFN